MNPKGLGVFGVAQLVPQRLASLEQQQQQRQQQQDELLNHFD
jgi:hypothetical protein